MYWILTATLALVLLPGVGAQSVQTYPFRVPSSSPKQFRFSQVRFSPDGLYILAQDHCWITVLSARPLHILFRAPAEDAAFARFTPDSRQLMFLSSATCAESPPDSRQLRTREGPHLERWSLSDRVRVDAQAIRPKPAIAQELSPDGRVLASVDSEGTLLLADTVSGDVIYEKKKFGQRSVDWSPGPVAAGRSGNPVMATIAFSQDSRFVLALPRHAGATLAYDLHDRAVVKLEGSLRKLKSAQVFTFLAADRVMVSEDLMADIRTSFECTGCRTDNIRRPSTGTATVLAFPSGETLSKPALPLGPVLRAADPSFVLIRPFEIDHSPEAQRTSTFNTPLGTQTITVHPFSSRAAAVDFATGQVITSETPALDVFGNLYVAGLPNGDLGLYERGKGLLTALTIAER